MGEVITADFNQVITTFADERRAAEMTALSGFQAALAWRAAAPPAGTQAADGARALRVCDRASSLNFSGDRRGKKLNGARKNFLRRLLDGRDGDAALAGARRTRAAMR